MTVASSQWYCSVALSRMRIEASDEQQDTMATEQRSETSNKLRDGPCAEHYIELEKCGTEKKITSSHMVSLYWYCDGRWTKPSHSH